MNRKSHLHWVFVVLGCLLLDSIGAQEKERLVRVRDHNGVGVKSDIYVKSFEREDEKEPTNDDGIGRLPVECQHTEVRIVAKPVNPFYSQNGRVCSANSDLEIPVIPQSYADLLDSTAQRLKSEGQFAAAAMVLTEANYLVLDEDSTTREAKAAQAVILFGQELGLESSDSIVFDPYQDRFVMSPKLHQMVFEYQGENRLELSGRIDYPTLRAAAGKDLRQFVPAPSVFNLD